MEKSFESIAELVKDPYFVQKVTDAIEEMIKARLIRPEPKKGYRYIRNWYDRMRSNDQLYAPFFIGNIEAIWNKRSSLSSEVRQIVQEVCDHALYATHEYYKSLPEDVKQPEKPKRGRKKKVLVIS